MRNSLSLLEVTDAPVPDEAQRSTYRAKALRTFVRLGHEALAWTNCQLLLSWLTIEVGGLANNALGNFHDRF